MGWIVWWKYQRVWAWGGFWTRLSRMNILWIRGTCWDVLGFLIFTQLGPWSWVWDVIFLEDNIFRVYSVNLSFLCPHPVLCLQKSLPSTEVSVWPLTSLIRINTTQRRDFVLYSSEYSSVNVYSSYWGKIFVTWKIVKLTFPRKLWNEAFLGIMPERFF